MKKLYLIILMLLILFIPTTNAVAVYQLDQPIRELDNYTLREVFENRNMAMPDLTGKTEISAGVYRLGNVSSVILDYNIHSGQFVLNGTPISSWVTFPNTFNIQPMQGTFSLNIISGSSGLGAIYWNEYNPPSQYLLQNIRTGNRVKNDINITEVMTGITFSDNSRTTYNNYTFTLQLEKGSTATPYQVPTVGLYSDIDVSEFNLTPEQIQKYYDLYLEAVRFEQENIEAGKDPGDYQNIFRSIINGVKGLMQSMGDLWYWLNAPLITTEMSDYSFSIDWSWNLIGVIRQMLNASARIVLQVIFIVPSLMFSFMGIPARISILSLVFSNLVFVLLAWIMVKSFVI